MRIEYWSYNKLTEEVELIKYKEEWWDIIIVDRVDVQMTWMRWWGSFLRALWEALSHADTTNAKKIIDNFNNYIIDYINNDLLYYRCKEWPK